MNLFLKIFFIILFSTFALFAQECFNTLKINSDISEVNIFINDSLISSNGNIDTELNDGRYIIIATENSGKWNAKTFSDTVFLSGCETKIINYYFRNETLLETIPSDVYVYSNDSLIGFSPLKIPKNFGELKLAKPGYVERKINIDDKSYYLIELNYNGIVKSEPFVETTLFKVLTGSVIVLGAVTAYFKLKADDKFDEYRFSGNKKFLDETNKYDTISGISLALFQINFGYIIYRFLSE